MENKPRRSYGRRTTDENRPDRPKTRRTYGKQDDGAKPRRYEKDDPSVKRPYRAKSDSDRPQKTFDRPKKTYGDRPKKTYGDRPKKPAVARQTVEEGGLIRLNKFIANSGICSRREADTYIETGVVTVNGVKVTELGAKIDPTKDDVRFNGTRIKGEKKVYIVMNKPKDFVTTMSDPHADRTVMDLISKSLCPERVFPVGRLDKATTGVLLFTNDGDLTEKLTHPKHEVRKIYQATLDKNLKKEDFDKILSGIELEDGFIAADALSYVEGDKTQIGLEIHSGRNRIVRRIFEHLGYKVKKLDRVYFAGLTKKNLRRGAWRFLDEKEIGLLKMGAFN
ncbi:MAG: rRNA pseudouridine synthase [Bacteroidales bacterium]|nr:rRNA pseudouridine synthase [Bacteroidales bacterium]